LKKSKDFGDYRISFIRGQEVGLPVKRRQGKFSVDGSIFLLGAEKSPEILKVGAESYCSYKCQTVYLELLLKETLDSFSSFGTLLVII